MLLLDECGTDAGTSSDEPLWDSVASGDLEAFEILVRKHQAPLIRFLERFLGNRSDAEDVAQETFLAALRKPEAYQGRASVRSWLFAIAKNSAREFLRAKSRRRHRETVRAVEDKAGSPDPSETWVRELLASLPEKLRDALLFCDLHGFTYEEAAEVLKCPVKTVSTRLFRAREKMMEFLKARGLP
jgi:RNA polymerase sigma-70 factor (ECF subfamily)